MCRYFRLLTITFSLLASAVSGIRAQDAGKGSVFDVRTFGARGDGKALDTSAIQSAIDACHTDGGGTVLFPTGAFLSGTITLKSNVTLHLSAGAVLRGSSSMSDYPVKHLIVARGTEKIAIEGRGTIDGQGDSFLDKEMKPLPRPSPLIEIWDSRDVVLEGFTILRSPAWTIHPKNCERVKIRGVTILNNLRAINSDGIGIDSCRNVIISDCHIEAGDDCIVLKTTRRGTGPVQPTENVVVTNCVLTSAATALKLGTETHADFRHILFSNCVIRDSRTGIGLLAKDGGAMENVRFSQIVMTTLPKWGQGLEWPIVVDVEKRTADSRVSRMRDVAFSDITIYSKGRVMASGLPESRIENLSFRNVTVRIGGYEKIEVARKMRGGANTVAEGTPDYAPTPAAFIFAYANNVTVDGLTIEWPQASEAPPLRHAIYGAFVDNLATRAVAAKASISTEKPIVLADSTHASP